MGIDLSNCTLRHRRRMSAKGSDKWTNAKPFIYALLLFGSLAENFSGFRLNQGAPYRKFRPMFKQSIPSKLFDSSNERHFWTTLPLGHRTCLPRVETANRLSEDVMVIAYVDNHSKVHHRGVQNFMRSAAKAGYMNVKIVSSSNDNKGSSNVFWLQRSLTYIQQLDRVPPGQVVVIADALDLLFALSPTELLARYQKASARVVFASEALCDTDGCRERPDYVSSIVAKAPLGADKPFLNAGFVVGRAGTLADVLREASAIMREESCDDQAALTKLYLSNSLLSAEITLDYQAQLVAVISPAEKHFALHWKLERDGRGRTKFQSVFSGHQPVAIHVAGVRYGDDPLQKFNRCQQHLSRIYNQLIAVAWDAEANQQHRHRVVVSMTTTPLRIKFLGATLRSISLQTLQPDAIYLNVPHYSKRFETQYDIPAELYAYDNLHIQRSQDYGPATKLLPTIFAESDPDTLIITIDDEYIYSRLLLEELVAVHIANPGAAFAYAGQNIEADDHRPLGVAVLSADVGRYKTKAAGVDILEGFLGAIYRRSFFDPQRLADIDPLCFSTDDIWISGYLSRQGIPRIKLPYTRFHRPTELPHDKLGPSRTMNLQGPGNNEVCAYRLLENFKLGWLPDPEVCPISYQYLDVNSDNELGEKVDDNWDIDSILSPCNPKNLEGRPS